MDRFEISQGGRSFHVLMNGKELGGPYAYKHEAGLAIQARLADDSIIIDRTGPSTYRYDRETIKRL